MYIYCGGLPQDHSGDHHAITIMHGVQHVALDFSSPVVDIFTINGELVCGEYIYLWILWVTNKDTSLP